MVTNTMIEIINNIIIIEVKLKEIAGTLKDNIFEITAFSIIFIVSKNIIEIVKETNAIIPSSKTKSKPIRLFLIPKLFNIAISFL